MGHSKAKYKYMNILPQNIILKDTASVCYYCGRKIGSYEWIQQGEGMDLCRKCYLEREDSIRGEYERSRELLSLGMKRIDFND